MTVLPVIIYPDPLLRQTCVEVTTFDNRLQRLISDMFETMDAAKGIGLAAPQIGILERILVVGYNKKRFELINPKITFREGKQSGEEGCLSLPEVLVVVDRDDIIKVEAQNRMGENIVLEEEGMISVVIQHEMDHLDGVLIIDKGAPN